jgi:hypothetical protein
MSFTRLKKAIIKNAIYLSLDNFKLKSKKRIFIITKEDLKLKSKSRLLYKSGVFMILY